MKLAIMQPYFFPYLGYFQLVHAVDAFVVYDDVNYIKQGWINRNYILGNGHRQRITLPVRGASPNKLINQITTGSRRKLNRSLQQCYSRAPFFDSVNSIIADIIARPEQNLARFLDHQLRRISDHLGLRRDWIVSSTLQKDNRLRGQDKVIAICKELGAKHFINLPGGESLYDRDAFAREGLNISFLKPKPVDYFQGGGKFVPNLSIIDVMMFNDLTACAALMKQYDLAG